MKRRLTLGARCACAALTAGLLVALPVHAGAAPTDAAPAPPDAIGISARAPRGVGFGTTGRVPEAVELGISARPKPQADQQVEGLDLGVLASGPAAGDLAATGAATATVVRPAAGVAAAGVIAVLAARRRPALR